MGMIKKELCTQKVIAECTGKYRDSESHRIKYPVYEFDYGGKHYKVSKEQKSPGFTAEIGSSYEIYINPDNPEEYYHPQADAADKRWKIFIITPFVLLFLFQLYLVLKDLFL
ncbi:MAG: hypothetical protein IJZ95_02170 [Oscillospiraceae bacterium]|nr:hypothetical protein [Oscillospiraceae bacterium]